MFPLSTVLLPGAVLPLHVFEPRYKAMVSACLTMSDPSFGVVLIARGHEVGGDDVRTDVGCRAAIVDAARAPDGRWAITAVGAERIRVVSWLDDDPYPRAVVEPWPDPPADPAVLSEEVLALEVTFRRLLSRAEATGHAAAAPDVELPSDPTAAVWAMAVLSGLGPHDCHTVLSVPAAGDRVDVLGRLLDERHDILIG